MVTSTIPSGQVAGMDTSAAEKAPGVLAVITPRNAQRLPGAERRITVLQDTNVYYQNQPIAVVVAETLEQAHHAANWSAHAMTPSRPSSTLKPAFRNPIPESTTANQAMPDGAT